MSESNALDQVGYGIVLESAPLDDPSNFADAGASLLGIEGIGETNEPQDNTCISGTSGFREKGPSDLSEQNPITLTLFYGNAADNAALEALKHETRVWRITFPGDATRTYTTNGYLHNFGVETPMETGMRQTVMLQPSGAPTWT